MYLHWHKLRARCLKLRYRIAFAALLLLCLLGLILNYHAESGARVCFMTNGIMPPDVADFGTNSSKGISYRLLDDILGAAVQPTPGRSIFFHETSCQYTERSSMHAIFGSISPPPAQPNAPLYLAKLNARQACAIESAALHNPNFSVFVMFASAVYYDNVTAKPLFDALLKYSNVHLRYLNLWTYAANTPINDWLSSGSLFRSHYVLSHVSDFLRYITLWRYGGTYLDMDVVVLKSLEHLPPNYTGAESDTHLAAGVMNFAADGFGHEVASQCLNDFQHYFDGSSWGNNGPGVITRVARRICKLENVKEMVNRAECKGFYIYGRDTFYAIPYSFWWHFFEAQYLEQTLKRTEHSYIVHLWNKFSKQRRVRVGSKVAYGKLAEKHCPKVYAAAGDYF